FICTRSVRSSVLLHASTKPRVLHGCTSRRDTYVRFVHHERRVHRSVARVTGNRLCSGMLHHRTYILDENLDWVVLVHGAGGSSSIWFRQLRAYAEQFNVLLVDLRGHGESALIADNRDGERYTFESVSRDVLEVLDHLDIERAHFVGISLGCLIIRTIAELAPERVQSM